MAIKVVRELSEYLHGSVIPKFVEELSGYRVSSPLDGAALSDLMHARGIGMRHLGRVAFLVRGTSLYLST